MVRRFAIIGLLACASVVQAAPADDCRKAIQQNIDRVDARMRQPYGAAEGIRLDKIRRDLRALYNQCRKDPTTHKKAPTYYF